MYIALTSDTLTDGELYKYATSQVQQRINILPGVSQVQIFGVKSAIRIKVDPGALASRNITFDELGAPRALWHILRRRGTVRRQEHIVRSASEWPGDRCRRLSQHDRRPRQRWRAGLPARCRQRSRQRAGRTALTTFLCARLPRSPPRVISAGRFPASRRERRRSRAVHQQFASADAARVARLDQPHPDLRSRAKHRELSR